MNYRGRHIDPISFWNKYVEFPANMKIDGRDEFSPKMVCPNPEHDTLKHHFQINLIQPTVHCFAACGISGSYEHAVCIVEGLYEKFKVDLRAVEIAKSKEARNRTPADREALRKHNRAIRQATKSILRFSSTRTSNQGYTPAAKKRKRSGTIATVRPNELLYESYLPRRALEYLDGRGITPESIAEWEIGWLPDEKRIVIPAKDENGITRFLIKRAISDRQQPKYLYTEGFPKTSLLFGLDKIDLGLVKSEGLVLVEGSTDVIALRQSNLKTAGAILGTGISDQQVRIIARVSPPRIYLLFDKDSAGVHNIEIAVSKLRKCPLYVVRYTKGKTDPAELGELVHRQIKRAVPAMQFVRSNNLNVKPRERKVITVG